MKKYLSLLFIIMLGFGFYVKADAGPPAVAKYKIIVINKNGAACYEDETGKVKTGESMPYNKIVYAFFEIKGDYSEVYYDLDDGSSRSCYVSVKDIAPKDSKFGVNNEDVEKITPVKAVILANGGLNLRKGPSTLFGRIITVKQGEVVTLTHKTGTYWYYANYNGNTGWMTGENRYFGYENDGIIYSYDDINIYDTKDINKKIGTIPKFTEVTDYLVVVEPYAERESNSNYYVNYKGLKGVIISSVPFKVEGKIKLDKDTKINNGKTLTKGTYDYTINHCYEDYDETLDELVDRCKFYIPSVNGTISLLKDKGYIVSGEKTVKKASGYIGEGLFGEAKTKKDDTPIIDEPIDEPIIDEPVIIKEEDNKEFKFDTEMIIICVMGAIILGLTAFIIIKFANVNKKEKVQKQEVKKEEVKEEQQEEKKEIEPEKKEE